MKQGVLVLLALAVLLSGCAGSGALTKGVAKPTSTVGVDDPNKGKLLGSVVDDEEIPIEGATVGILDATGKVALAATTDAAGSFAFLGLEPGLYVLSATKLGYADFSDKSVNIVGGEAVEKLVVLAPLPSNEPYAVVFGKTGISSGWGYKLPVLGEKEYPLTIPGFNYNYNDFKAPGPLEKDFPSAIQAIVGELQWTNTQALGGNLLFIVSVVQSSDTTDKVFIRKEAPSPINVRVDQAAVQAVVNKGDTHCKPDGDFCHMEVFVYPGRGNTNLDVDASLALQQQYNTKVSVFYRMDAPKDHTAL